MFKQLEDRFHDPNKYIQDLYLANLYNIAVCLEDTKSTLPEDLYCWVLENSNFQQKDKAKQSWLLQVKSNSGKGKIILLCSIIYTLSRLITNAAFLSYFSCYASYLQINKTTNVLQSFIYMFVAQQLLFVLYIWKEYSRPVRPHTGTCTYRPVLGRTGAVTTMLQANYSPYLGAQFGRTYLTDLIILLYQYSNYQTAFLKQTIRKLSCSSSNVESSKFYIFSFQ